MADDELAPTQTEGYKAPEKKTLEELKVRSLPLLPPFICPYLSSRLSLPGSVFFEWPF
jgi:hypothetical protein